MENEQIATNPESFVAWPEDEHDGRGTQPTRLAQVEDVKKEGTAFPPLNLKLDVESFTTWLLGVDGDRQFNCLTHANGMLEIGRFEARTTRNGTAILELRSDMPLAREQRTIIYVEVRPSISEDQMMVTVCMWNAYPETAKYPSYSNHIYNLILDKSPSAVAELKWRNPRTYEYIREGWPTEKLAPAPEGQPLEAKTPPETPPDAGELGSGPGGRKRVSRGSEPAIVAGYLHLKMSGGVSREDYLRQYPNITPAMFAVMITRYYKDHPEAKARAMGRAQTTM